MHIKLDILRIRKKYFSGVTYNIDGEGKVHLETSIKSFTNNEFDWPVDCSGKKIPQFLSCHLD